MYPEIPYVGYTEQKVTIPLTFPPQHQNVQPGLEYKMEPLPIFDNPNDKGGDKLLNKTVIISRWW